MNTNKNLQPNEKILTPKAGLPVLFFCIVGLVISIIFIILGGNSVSIYDATTTQVYLGIALIIIGVITLIKSVISLFGLKAISPNEALVLTLFGDYYGTINKSGFYYVNPFCTAYNPTKVGIVVTSPTAGAATVNAEDNNNKDKTSGKKISLKAITLNNRTQKVNDLNGNPIEISAMVIWKVKSPYQAVFAVDNYLEYISLQSDSNLRSVASQYAYDSGENSNDITELTLRGNSDEIAKQLKDELQKKVEVAGLEVIEVKITHLAYAQEIAAAMLQRQQASAILSARRLIVEGAVGMVQQALDKLDNENIVELDDERKATMISNLLVVLCANKEAQPIVNSGSIY